MEKINGRKYFLWKETGKKKTFFMGKTFFMQKSIFLGKKSFFMGKKIMKENIFRGKEHFGGPRGRAVKSAVS